MPMLNKIARIATKPFPKTISPRAHAMMDYITVGFFLASAGWFWGRNKRAALAALICGGADLAVNLLTDYPGGVQRVISYPAHREIDLGLAAMTAAMPEFMAFQHESEKKFFLAQGALITATVELTQFPNRPQRAEIGGKRTRAA